MAATMAELRRMSEEAREKIRKTEFEKITSGIASTMKTAAAEGKRRLEVMTIHPHEAFVFKWFHLWTVRKGENLADGLDKDVFRYCQDSGWNPTICYFEYGHASDHCSIDIRW